MEPILQRLLSSDEPAIRYKVRIGVLGEEPDAPALRALQAEIRRSERVAALLRERSADGTIPGPIYRKWSGAHWVLAALADLGYPAGEAELAPLVAQVCAGWLSQQHVTAVRVINGRARRCGSQEGNALWAMLTLGFVDERADALAENLMHWQWPDGGWNCDKTPSAHCSSLHETWLPLRALARYARLTGHVRAHDAVARAAEVFLSRGLFRRRSTGTIIRSQFLLLTYPSYWHYGLLCGLKTMAEAGLLGDPRCAEALDVLERKRLPDGGFPAEITHYGTAPSRRSHYSPVKWGARDAGAMNEWVTAEALAVLAAAGRLAR